MVSPTLHFTITNTNTITFNKGRLDEMRVSYFSEEEKGRAYLAYGQIAAVVPRVGDIVKLKRWCYEVVRVTWMLEDDLVLVRLKKWESD
jgi:hypothetical protein